MRREGKRVHMREESAHEGGGEEGKRVHMRGGECR